MPETIVRDFLAKERDPSFQAENVRFRPTDIFDSTATYRITSRSAKLHEDHQANGRTYGIQFTNGVAFMPPAPTEATAEHKLRALMDFYNTNPVGVQLMREGNLVWDIEPAYVIEKLSAAEARKYLSDQYGVEEKAP